MQTSSNSRLAVRSSLSESSGNPSPLVHAPHDFQTTFTPEGSHLTFSSEFDSGNLKKAKYDEQAAEYLCYQTRDAQDTAHEAPYTTWFHFSVSGAKAGETVKFCIKNMNKQMRLYKQGYRPVYKVVPNVVLASGSVEEAAVSGYNTWQPSGYVAIIPRFSPLCGCIRCPRRSSSLCRQSL